MREQQSVTGVPVPDSIQGLKTVHAPKMLKWDYCKIDDGGSVEEVHCKLCGVRIIGARAWGDPEMRKNFDETGTILLTQHTRVMPFNTFAQFRLIMDDGSAHITTACAKCAGEVIGAQDLDVLNALHASDIASLAESSRTADEMAIVEFHSNRKVIGAEKE